ncbi:MAG: hypothetical protein ACPG4W_07840, partial [Flavobacteriales bacterium]
MKTKKHILHKLIIAVVSVYVLSLMFPQIWFSNQFKYKNFSVYYHDNELNINELKSILDTSSQLIEQSAYYKPEHQQKLFFCSGFTEFSFFALGSRKAFAVNYPISQRIFLSKTSIHNNQSFRNGEQQNRRSLSGVIAHETTHSMLENHFGFLAYKLLPTWKNEGYCDYIAQDSSFDEMEGLKAICDNKEPKDNHSFNYLKFRLLTKYCFEHLKLNTNNFFASDIDKESLN